MEVNIMRLLESVHPLPLPVKNYLGQILQHEVIKKGRVILRAGQVNDRIYFVIKGLLWTYYLKKDTRLASWFMAENDFAVSVSSFYLQKPSYEYMQALEETHVFYITFSQLQELYEKYPEFNIHGRVLQLPYYIEADYRRYSLQMTTSEERFEWLRQTKPHLIERVPAKLLASYLGMTPEQFSRVRKWSNQHNSLKKAS